MPNKIKIVRKRTASNLISDPLVRQRLLWTVGHCMTIFFGSLYTVHYVFQKLLFFKYRSWRWLFLRVNRDYSFVQGSGIIRWLLRHLPAFFYELSLVGVFISYGVTMLQNWGGVNASWGDLMSSDNAQSMLLALMWFIGGGRSFFKLLPFMGISYLHLLLRDHEMHEEIDVDEYTKEHSDLLRIIAYTELITLGNLVLDTLMLKSSMGGFLLIVYIGVFVVRINYTQYTQLTILRLMEKYEDQVPKGYVQYWRIAKKFIYLRLKEVLKREGKN